MNKLERTYFGKNVLITGGLGFLGTSLSHRLVELGAGITLADACLPQYGSNPFNLEGIEEGVKLNVNDVRDESAMNHLVRNQDFIFHFAGQVAHNESLENPFLDLDINCKGTLTLLEACRKNNPDAKLFFSGSRMQYGKTEKLPVDEGHPLRPKSPYGVHKAAAEEYFSYYNREQGLKTTSFRITNPYGPRSQMKHSKYGMVNWFIRQAMDGNPIKVFGEGKQIRDYIYVDDLVEAFLMTGIGEETDGEIFNAGSGIPVEFVEMAKTIVDVVGNGTVEYTEWPADYKNIETGDFYADISKIRSMTGWQPKNTLEEGIRKTFEFYTKNKKHYW
ncbi:NAD-dependent epimerase [Candidatus Pacearchaeota archaeon]|nr:NAD-dependent epimerase [Candidatus Pacearchaeota archaeon]|tara:strand:+ start:7637 stop:8632 length:996 start_codon:yes stop_codon:yes gene_type:complete